MSQAPPAARPLLPLLMLGLSRLPVAVGAEPPSAPSPGALQTCAGIDDGAARLACYDKLAGRAAAAAPLPRATTRTATAPAASHAAPTSRDTFGLYSAEHPTAPTVAPSLQAAVTSLGRSPSGRTTVILEGGAQWELDEPDPLLAVGDVVSITRAALGSYLMQTPTHRMHRVRRLP